MSYGYYKFSLEIYPGGSLIELLQVVRKFEVYSLSCHKYDPVSEEMYKNVPPAEAKDNLSYYERYDVALTVLHLEEAVKLFDRIESNPAIGPHKLTITRV